MKNLLISLISIILLLPAVTKAQDEEKKFGINFSGFVKNDVFFDTRQTVSVREGHFLLYPSDISFDANEEDINTGLNYNFLSIQSRLKGTISGPDAFGAKTSGAIEGAFFGHTNSDINGFRLRHAFAKLKWEKTEFLAGQYWHPMFVTGCFPGTISFNTGVPFQPFSRNPQLRLSHKLGNLNIIGVAQSQRDFASPGGSTSLRNSGIPDMHIQFQYETKDKKLFTGFGGGFKMLKPALSTIGDSGAVYKTDETVNSFSAIAFLKYKTPKLTFKLEGVWGQNMYDLLMLGGYAVEYDSITNTTGHVSYTTLDNFSVWTDIHSNGKKIQAGLFAGYTKNLGSLKNIVTDTYSSRGSNIAYVYRVSPRLVFISGKFKFAFEFEFTNAAYARASDDFETGINSLGDVQDYEDVYNLRSMFSVIYSF